VANIKTFFYINAMLNGLFIVRLIHYLSKLDVGPIASENVIVYSC